MNNSSDVFLGRQPILDLRQRLFAYELLFRSGHVGFAEAGDNVQMTATVIVNTFNELGVETALGDRRGFINVDEAFLFSDTLELLPPHAVVLEVLETVPATDEVVARCRELRSAGYTLALDDLTQIRPDYAPLVDLADIIKVDIAPLTYAEIARIADELRPLGKQLLAEKVETRERMEVCRELGFTLFQGYYFARPSVIAGRRVDYGKLSLVRLLSLAIGDADTPELESELKREPGLVLKMLRMINSAHIGVAVKITSLRHAITMLGRRQLMRWLQLLIFASSGEEGGGNPLLATAAARGRLLELLATALVPQDAPLADQGFMTGVMSMMPVAFGIPMDEIIVPLNLPDEVGDALCLRAGRLGAMLDLAEAAETDDLPAVKRLLETLGVELDTFNRAQTEALAWSNRLEDEAD
ncbi:MAG: EAL domain-containing protein [Azoarcus sp.]|nr:EAL domain-containing protein [Azoarcus sp.]